MLMQRDKCIFIREVIAKVGHAACGSTSDKMVVTASPLFRPGTRNSIPLSKSWISNP